MQEMEAPRVKFKRAIRRLIILKKFAQRRGLKFNIEQLEIGKLTARNYKSEKYVSKDQL